MATGVPKQNRLREQNAGRKETLFGESKVVLNDNLVELQKLHSEGVRTRLIYADLPYGTGFDFLMPDGSVAYHDHLIGEDYAKFIRPRIEAIRDCLADDGSIYIHIGHQMVGVVKNIMDDVFGQKNFRNLITRRKCSSKNQTSKQYANINDFILFYTKSSSYVWNQQGQTPDDEWIVKEYPKKDSKRRYKLVPVYAPGTRNGDTGKAWRGKLPPKGKHWQTSPDNLDKLDEAGLIHWSKTGNPRKKVYLPDDKLMPYNDYWHDFRDAHHQSISVTGYPTEKNLEMLRMIVRSSTNEGDLVLDPFCGSGTSLEAAFLEGRNFIGIDNSEKAFKTTIDRMESIKQH